MEGSLAEIARYMRMGRQIPEGVLADRIEALRLRADPLIHGANVRVRIPLGTSSPYPRLQRLIDRSDTLRDHLRGCRSAYLLCATIGTAIDALQRRLAVVSATDALIIQAIGAERIEAYAETCEEEIRSELADGESLVTRYSPGYGDFPLSSQPEFFAILDPPLRIGVSLTDTNLMVPSKSITAIIGILPPSGETTPKGVAK